MVGSHLGLGTKDHLFAHTEGCKYTTPLGPLHSWMLEQPLGIRGHNTGHAHGVHGSYPLHQMGMAYGAYTVA